MAPRRRSASRWSSRPRATSSACRPLTIDGFDQLCRVTRPVREGRRRARRSTASACRTSRSASSTSAQLESVRDVSTWFEPDDGFALTSRSARRKAKAHDRDVVAAAVFEPERLRAGRGSAPVDHLRGRRVAGPRRARAVARPGGRRASSTPAAPPARRLGGRAAGRWPAARARARSRSAGTAAARRAPACTCWPAGDEPRRGDHQRLRRRAHLAVARLVRRLIQDSSGISLESLGKAMAAIADAARAPIRCSSSRPAG